MSENNFNKIILNYDEYKITVQKFFEAYENLQNFKLVFSEDLGLGKHAFKNLNPAIEE
jgi:hypothetical protein